jgi:hypothetical protein
MIAAATSDSIVQDQPANLAGKTLGVRKGRHPADDH